MILNRLFGFFIVVFGILGHLSIRFGERTMAFIRTQNALRHRQTANQPSAVAPSQTAPSMRAIVPRSLPMATPAIQLVAQPITQEIPISQPPPVAPKPLQALAVEPELEQFEPDDLDWAGSLSHAAVASQHLANILSMVRAGWIVVELQHLQDASPALDAMEAFQSRTAMALAPLLEQMTEAQHAEFFSDFGADFPTELQGIE